MIINKKYQDKRVAVLGFGKTGLSIIKSMLASGAKVFAYDDHHKECPINDNSLIFDSPVNHQNIDCLFVSPGINPQNNNIIKYAKDKGIVIKSDLDLLYETCSKAKYIGITGTNGKSTVTNLINHILLEFNKSALDHEKINFQCGGNIGIPVLNLQNTDSDQFLYLLELSSYQLDLIASLTLNIGVYINIASDHLDRYGNIENYFQAKAKIAAISRKNVISLDYPLMANFYNKLEKDQEKRDDIDYLIPFSIKRKLNYGVSLYQNRLDINLNKQRKNIKINNLPISLQGDHNKENIVAAVSTCLLINDKFEDWIEHLYSYQSLPHRMEFVHRTSKTNTLWINDSKATNTQSTKYSLTTFDKIHWIVGGLAKENSITLLKPYIKKVIKAYLIGSSTYLFAQQCEEIKLNYLKCFNLNQAIEEILKQNLQNSTVLLAPACSSFDQWQNFEERGNFFRAKVLSLTES